MAAASWTPGSIIHINDGTAEYDANYINNDAFGSQYRAFLTIGQVDLFIRHQLQTQRPGQLQNDRHNVSWQYEVPGTTSADPVSLYRASFSFETPKLGSQTVASQYLNALPALLSISAARSQLLTWRV